MVSGSPTSGDAYWIFSEAHQTPEPSARAGGWGTRPKVCWCVPSRLHSVTIPSWCAAVRTIDGRKRGEGGGRQQCDGLNNAPTTKSNNNGNRQRNRVCCGKFHSFRVRFPLYAYVHVRTYSSSPTPTPSHRRFMSYRKTT